VKAENLREIENIINSINSYLAERNIEMETNTIHPIRMRFQYWSGADLILQIFPIAKETKPRRITN